jgi:CxxC motif-containing protein (DUF1111 family)
MVAGASDRRPRHSVLSNEPQRVVALPAPGAADPPAGDVRSLGAELFARKWLPNDPRCHGGDGLGPVYNAASCLDCHNQGGPGGAGPTARNVELATGIGYMASPDTPVVVNGNVIAGNIGLNMVSTRPVQDDLVRAHPGFRDASSVVLHRFGVDPDYGRWRADFLTRCRPALPVQSVSTGRSVSISRSGRRHSFVRPRSPELEPADPPIPPALADNLSAVCREVAGQMGMNRVAFSRTARNAPPMFGAGLIDALSDRDLEREAWHQPHEVRGRVHRLKDGRVGRFGWKAQVASLEDFVLTACANELGLEVPGHHQAASPLAPDAQAKGLDLTAEECAALVEYVRSLPPPVSLAPSDAHASAAVDEGRKLFHSTGCASCHIPDLGSIRGIYSDLLLHDMGETLSDPGTYYGDDSDSLGAPKRGEWRTAPLWGIKDSAPYLHDGRARSLAQAVALHGGQGAASAHRFRMLGPGQQAQIQDFLNSLAAPGPAPSPEVRGAPGGARGSGMPPGA